MKTKRKRLVYLLFFLASGSAISQTTNSVEIKGKVVEINSKSPIYGVRVNIKDTEKIITTDSLGYFVIPSNGQFPLTLNFNGENVLDSKYELKSFSDEPILISLEKKITLNEIVVTGRRRQEVVQEIPIPITVISGKKAEDAGAFNVNRIKELVPSVQLYSSNARNTTLNIRGLGSTFG